MKFAYLILCFVFLVSCKNESSQNEEESNSIKVEEAEKQKTYKPSIGISSYSGVNDLDTSYNNLIGIFNKNQSISILSELNYSEMAQSIGQDLKTTKTVFFGNPNLGTPLMQTNPLTGLDLPQKIVYLNTEDSNRILYNDMDYLNHRYGLDDHPNLSIISNTLKALVEKTSNSSIEDKSKFKIKRHEGIITKTSNYDFGTTKDYLLTLLESNNDFKIIAELDHQANAKKANLEMNPSFLVVFSNPKLDIPLLQNQQNMALDLPQKMLIWQNDEGEVFVSYNDSYFLSDRHQLNVDKNILKKINLLLDNISSAAID